MDSANKLEDVAIIQTRESEKVAIVEYPAPGIMWEICIYAPKMPLWSTWEKLVVAEYPCSFGISDLFWRYEWYPLPEGMEMTELEASVRQIYPQFPEGVYEIHAYGAA
jgi:hypothetical protein